MLKVTQKLRLGSRITCGNSAPLYDIFEGTCVPHTPKCLSVLKDGQFILIHVHEPITTALKSMQHVLYSNIKADHTQL